jgi:hypothetical protein
VDRHPIRLVVTDDLQRSRLTVVVRWILAIPHYFWLALWTIAAIGAAIASWVATLAQGQTPPGLHRFLAQYVRYVTQLQAYLLLAAELYPRFTPEDGYAIDLEIDPPAPQRRWTVALRIFVALPALLLANALISLGANAGWAGRSTRYRAGEWGVAGVVAVLSWFVCLAVGRMPRGFRDLQAFALRYCAQTWAYLLLLTDRYPDARPNLPAAAPPDTPHPVGVTLTDDLARTRLTVFFRILLALPHVVWIALWTVVLVPVEIVAWMIVLASGRLPAGLHRFVSAYVRYKAHLQAFLYLTANPFPGFAGSPGYPVDVELPPAPELQPRGKTAVRILLAIPSGLVSGSLGTLAFAAAVLGWFAALGTGRMPRGLRDLGAWWIRYTAQSDAYALLLIDRYAYAGPYEFAEPPPDEAEAAELAAA